MKKNNKTSDQEIANLLVKPLLLEHLNWKTDDLNEVEILNSENVNFVLKAKKEPAMYVKVCALNDKMTDLESCFEEAVSKEIPYLMVTDGNRIYFYNPQKIDGVESEPEEEIIISENVNVSQLNKWNKYEVFHAVEDNLNIFNMKWTSMKELGFDKDPEGAGMELDELLEASYDSSVLKSNREKIRKFTEKLIPEYIMMFEKILKPVPARLKQEVRENLVYEYLLFHFKTVKELMEGFYNAHRIVIRALSPAEKQEEKDFKNVINMYFGILLNFLLEILEIYPPELISKEELKKGLDTIKEGLDGKYYDEDITNI